MSSTNNSYVHGYTPREAHRLNDQAATLDELIHHDSIFPPGSLVLEAGCGVGAQTRIVAPKNPEVQFVAIDISEESVREAQRMAKEQGITNVKFSQADIFNLPFPDATFDSIMLCFVLEHLSDPTAAIKEVVRVLKAGGSLVAIEGDHGSAYFYPDSQFAQSAIDSQVQLQRQGGGNANIGRELYPLLCSVGLANVNVSPRMVYADASRPHMVEGFTRNTFTAMIEGVREAAIAKGLVDETVFVKGIKDLHRTAEPDGVFCYTFFKGVGMKE